MDIPEMSRNDEFTKRLNAETVEIVLAVAGGLFVACLFVACLFVACLFALGIVLTVGHRPLLVNSVKLFSYLK
jgi:hypothetical protein